MAVAIDVDQVPQHRLGQPRHLLQEPEAPGLGRQPGEEAVDQVAIATIQRPQPDGGAVGQDGDLSGGAVATVWTRPRWAITRRWTREGESSAGYARCLLGWRRRVDRSRCEDDDGDAPMGSPLVVVDRGDGGEALPQAFPLGSGGFLGSDRSAFSTEPATPSPAARRLSHQAGGPSAPPLAATTTRFSPSGR
jgi:hypothetical protein